MIPSKRKRHLVIKKPEIKRVASLLESLPEGTLNIIAESLAEVEPGGVRGPSLVSRDMCSLGMACKALRSASRHGIQTLAQQVLHRLQQSTSPCTVLCRLPHTDAATAAAAATEAAALAASRAGAAADEADVPAEPSQPPDPRMTWAHWDAVLSAGTCSLQDLQEAASWLRMDNHTTLQTYPRDILEAAVRAAFGLRSPAPSVPAALLVACSRERCSGGITGDGPDNCAALHAALKQLAGLAREVWLPLGLQAQRWGYGRRRPPGWQQHTILPASQKGVAWALPGGLATIREGLAAAGIHSLAQLQQLVAAEAEQDTQRRAALAPAAAPAAAEQQQKLQQQQQWQKAVSEAWRSARRQAGQQRLAEQALQFTGQAMCSAQCGCVAAKWCVRQCCGGCCRKADAAAGPDVEPCVRHKERSAFVGNTQSVEATRSTV